MAETASHLKRDGVRPRARTSDRVGRLQAAGEEALEREHDPAHAALRDLLRVHPARRDEQDARQHEDRRGHHARDPAGPRRDRDRFVLTAIYVAWANKSYDPEVERLRAQLRSKEPSSPIGTTMTSIRRDPGRPPRAGCPAAAAAGEQMQTTLGSPSLMSIFFFFIIVAVTLVITYFAARKTKTSSEFYAAGRSVSALAERLRARGRLHVRRVVPRHLRHGRAQGLRRHDLRDRLARRLARAHVPRRRAAAEPRQVHLRRRGRVPAAPEAGAHRRRDRRHPDRALLHDRPDGRLRARSSSSCSGSSTSTPSSSSAW